MEQTGRLTIGRYVAMLYRMAAIYLGQELPAVRVGAGQYIFLAELFDQEGQSQDELTQKAYVDKANTARALNKLEEAGYVKRESDHKDHRVKRAFLLPEAREIEGEFWEILTRWSDILTQGFSPQRRDRLLRDLKEMADNAAGHLKRY